MTKPTVILGITGSIAAYKSCELVRLLTKQGHDVRVVMTPFAAELVGPLTFASLTGHPVFCDFSAESRGGMTHIELANRADLFLIAPADANTIAKLAHGICDNLLTTLALVATCPKIAAPAMNVRMWRHPRLQRNLSLLQDEWEMVPPEEGLLACGDEGEGKMADPVRIAERVVGRLARGKKLAGKRVVITLGPTREYLDDVRFLSNASSGKMGVALAQEALRRGAQVTLISGPAALPPLPAETIRVVSAEEMLSATLRAAEMADVVIMAAAVADFRPAERTRGKLKKGEHDALKIRLEKTPDILQALGETKQDQHLVGFCLDTRENLREAARSKRAQKNLDLVVANPLESMEADETEFYLDGGDWKPLGYLSKQEAARRIFDELETMESKRRTYAS